MSTLSLEINGGPVQLRDGATVADAVRHVTGQVSPRGIAVAVNREVVPRSEWASTRLGPGCRVVVVEAAAGG